jgi:outer membrane protein W
MKHSALIATLVMVSMTVFGQNATAPSLEKGKFSVSLGYGLVNLGTVIKKITTAESADQPRIEKYQERPIGLQVEYALSNRWGLGLSAYYEKYQINSSSIGPFSSERFYEQEKYELLSVMARGSYHFGKKDNRFDPYIGAGIGFTEVNDDFFKDKWYTAIGELKLGGRYFFTKNIGVHLEAGLGTIFVQTGLTVKF